LRTHGAGTRASEGRTRLLREAQALALAERAVPIFDDHVGAHENEHFARFTLARAIVATGGDRTRARALAEQARDAWRHAGDAGPSRACS
jgi:hypothetical protein